MRRYLLLARRFFGCADGTTAVEYSVLLALMMLLVVAATQTLGCNLRTTLNRAAESISN